MLLGEDREDKPSRLLEAKVKGLGLDNVLSLPLKRLRRAKAHHQGPQPLELVAQSGNLTILPW